MKKALYTSVLVLITFTLFFYVRWPIVTGNLTKQTIYLSILNCFHFKESNAVPRYMLIDDDTGPGIFTIHEICERVGVKATFAVVPATLDGKRCEALKEWSSEGYGIALHGYDHSRWKNWNTVEIINDINRSISFLENKGIASKENIRLVVSPKGDNTHAIRKATVSQNLKLVTGANIINPDVTTSQWGRLYITKDTDLKKLRLILEKTKKNMGFVIFGTHSSNPNEFSTEKTEAVLQIVVELGFKPY